MRFKMVHACWFCLVTPRALVNVMHANRFFLGLDLRGHLDALKKKNCPTQSTRFRPGEMITDYLSIPNRVTGMFVGK